MNVHHITIHNSKDMESTQVSSSEGLGKEMWDIYTVEYYAVIKRMKLCPLQDMDEAEDRYPKQISRGTENKVSQVLTYKWELNIRYSWT